MTITKALDDNFMPYAPSSSVIQVIKRYHERGLPEPLTVDVLQQVGIPASMFSPTFRSLLFLGLVDQAGMKTAKFENIRRSSSDDYPDILAAIIREAYADIFTIADPKEDELTAISDAFRRYDPANQRDKMVRLFIGLCEEAEIVQQGTHQTKPTRRPRASSLQPKPQRTPTPPVTETVVSSSEETLDLDYRLVSSIVQQLPKNGYWSAEKRGKWLAAMTSAIDLLIDVQDESESVNTTEPTELPHTT